MKGEKGKALAISASGRKHVPTGRLITARDPSPGDPSGKGEGVLKGRFIPDREARTGRVDSPREASLQDAGLSSAMEPGTSFLVPGWYDESLRDSGPSGRVAVDPIIFRCVR